jgi:hypothetical protein
MSSKQSNCSWTVLALIIVVTLVLSVITAATAYGVIHLLVSLIEGLSRLLVHKFLLPL